MTNCDSSNDGAGELLERVMGLLVDSSLQQRIDAPIDEALASFPCPEASERSQRVFHRVIGEFLVHVRKEVLAGAMVPSLLNALGEAMSLLEEGYHGTCSDGYDGALHDAVDPAHPGLQLVIERMAEAIRIRYRETYVRWVIDRHITSANWTVRCSLTALLMDQCRQWMPPDLQRCPPEQLVGCIPELLHLHLSMSRVLRSELMELFAQSS
ncbi:MAG: hypothetical protein NTV86_00960 [Planctomycetota bacterium]|nr:hypothetical protein [Planctomycetota bacterium]